MPHISARGLALAALRTWRKKKQFADAIASNALSTSALSPADRAFALDLFYGVLRNLALLDFWISQLRSGRVDVDLRDLLRLGLYQLLIAKIAEHAALNETVELAPKHHRSIANAMLRSATRDREKLLSKAKGQPLEVRTSHPKFLLERWQEQFGSEATRALCEWNNQPPQIYARINRLKLDRQSFLKGYPDAQAVPNLENFVVLRAPIPALEAGDCYVQDPSTTIACELLDPQPGERILEACAAPGGKTTYLAELMQNRGRIVASDREAQRLHLLQENLERLGVNISKIVQQDWSDPSITSEILSEAPFDRILVDAPCSNTGVMRRRIDVRWRLKPDDFDRMQTRQLQIARAVLPLLKPNGFLVYSTCSLEREENEQVVETLAREMSILRIEERKTSLPFRDNFDGAFAVRLRRRG